MDKSTKNSRAIGASVSITYGDESLKQIGFVKGGGGFKSFSQSVVHFGLGREEYISAIQIDWPDGTVDLLEEKLTANSRYKIIRLNKSSIQN